MADRPVERVVRHLSSWLRSREPPGAVAWVEVERDEEDATRFWAAVMDALRRSGALIATAFLPARAKARAGHALPPALETGVR